MTVKFPTIPASNEILFKVQKCFPFDEVTPCVKEQWCLSMWASFLCIECEIWGGIISEASCLSPVNIFFNFFSKTFLECTRHFIIWTGSWNISFTAYLANLGMQCRNQTIYKSVDAVPTTSNAECSQSKWVKPDLGLQVRRSIIVWHLKRTSVTKFFWPQRTHIKVIGNLLPNTS